MTITKIKNSQRKIVWSILYAIALLGIILMILDTYLRSDFEITGRQGARRVEGWHERLIFPFYFTFISNMFALVVSFMRAFKLDKNEKLMRRLEIFMAVNLIVTFIVYWATLFPKTRPDSGLSWTANMFVHLITPMFAVFAFVIQTYKNRKTYIYTRFLLESSKNLAFPLAYLVVATIIYFAIGSTVNFDSNIIPGKKIAPVGSGAVYFFLNYFVNSWYTTIIYIVAIAAAYYVFTLMCILMSNPKIKK